MSIIKCKMCGGDLSWLEGSSIAECDYCGTVQTVPKVDDEKKLSLFARANRLRSACEFDKAAGIYESILSDFPEEAEAYWGLVLCKYGIEYVDDPGTGKKVPTCHRSSFDSIMDDSDFEQAMENADEEALHIYREEAKQIEYIRKGILAVSSKEQPYNIFICYKETDAKGDRTVDSLLAQELYDHLTAKGYRVFFSRITLEDKLGQAYEPYIFSALNSAKVMLAVGTCYEHYNAVWVKNEWSRYLKIIAQDKSKYLIPCFKGLDAYDMPKEFAHLQAQDLGKVGAIQDLLRNMEKYIPLQKTAEQTTQNNISQKIQGQLRRGNMALEVREWDEADMFFENALNQDSKCAEAYVGKLLAEFHCTAESDLPTLLQPIQQSKNFVKAMRCADTALQDRLMAYQKQIRTNIQNRQEQLNALQYCKELVLSEIATADNAIKQAEQQANSIQYQISANHSHLLQLQKEAAEKRQQIESYKDNKPRNLGRILFYLLCFAASVLAALYCYNNPYLFKEAGIPMLIMFFVHMLVWITRDLEKGKSIGRIILRTPLLAIKCIGSFILVTVLYMLVFAVTGIYSDELYFLVACSPCLYIFKSVFAQRKLRKQYRKQLRSLKVLAHEKQRIYEKESANNPELQKLTKELEQANLKHQQVRIQYIGRIQELNKQYRQQAQAFSMSAEDIVPQRYRITNVH